MSADGHGAEIGLGHNDSPGHHAGEIGRNGLDATVSEPHRQLAQSRVAADPKVAVDGLPSQVLMARLKQMDKGLVDALDDAVGRDHDAGPGASVDDGLPVPDYPASSPLQLAVGIRHGRRPE